MLRHKYWMTTKWCLPAFIFRQRRRQPLCDEFMRLDQHLLHPLLAYQRPVISREPELAPERRPGQSRDNTFRILRTVMHGEILLCDSAWCSLQRHPVRLFQIAAQTQIDIEKSPAASSMTHRGCVSSAWSARALRHLAAAQRVDYFFSSAGGTTITVEPVVPVAPVSPVAPVEPVEPVAPVEPASPVEPLMPVAPVAPVAPAGPGVPAAGAASGAVAAGGITIVSFFSHALKASTESIAAISIEYFMVPLSIIK